MTRSTRLEVDLDAIAHNLRSLRAFMSERGARPPKIATVLKANAYGMGAVRVAGALLEAGADMLAVACLPEALELRAAHPEARILVMGHTPDEYLPEAVRAGIALTLFELAQARIVSREAVAAKRPCELHVKADTGMNRLGLKPGEGSAEFFSALAGLPGLKLEGLFTHLALRDALSDRRQFELFERITREAAEAGLSFPTRHVCDSIGLMRYPEFRLDMVRAGALLYGVRPLRAPGGERLEVHTPFALKTKVSRIARIDEGEGVGYDTSYKAPPGGALIATLPIGYADGYLRALSNKAEVLIRGQRAKVVGLVCMDQVMVDVTGVPGAFAGDEVLLLGESPEGSIGVMELADWALTNRNEIISAIGRRVPRAYFSRGAAAGEVDYLLS